MKEVVTTPEQATAAGQWVDVGAAEDFPEGSSRLVTVDGSEIGIFNLGQGRLRAVRNHCPHRGGPIGQAGFVTGTFMPSRPGEYVYGLADTVIRCPWHKWEFDMETGEPLFGISRLRLRTYEVRDEDGRIYLDMGRRTRASTPDAK